jgi:hypothetical protein
LELPGEKLIIKLWETLAEKGVGSLLSPWQVKRDGRARIEVRREELLALAQAETDAADIRAGRKRLAFDGSMRLLSAPVSDASSAETSPSDSIEPTLGLQSIATQSLLNDVVDASRKEINTSKAVIFAEEILANDSQLPPDRAIDDDWLFTWRDYAARVSNEELQRLWGSVLAGEVKSPGNFSFRTLDFLRALSKAEAEKVSQLARFVIEGRILRNQEQHLDKHGITFTRLLEMQDLGVISGVESIGLTTTYKSVTPDKFRRALRSNGKALLVDSEDAAKEFKLEVYLLTGVGTQLMGLGSFEPDIEYLRLVGKQILTQGFSVQLVDWKQISESEGNYSNAEKIDA